MLTSVMALLFLLMLCTGASAWTNRDATDCLPLSVCAAIVWLFLFYCMNMLFSGLVLFCLFSLFLWLLALVKHRQAVVQGLFSPGMLAYLGICTFFVVLFSRNRVCLIDELRLWAAVPKAMHELGTLQLGDRSPILSVMQSYPPGLPLLGFFFSAFSREFREGALFVAYSCGTLAFLMSAFSGWQWKQRRLLVPCALAVFAAPFLFTTHFGDSGLFGMTLFVDPLLGVTAGLAFSLAANDPFCSPFDQVRFSLLLMVLSLLKSTGVVFALCALACAFFLDRKARWKHSLGPVLALGAGIGLWKLLLALYGVSDLVSLDPHFLSALEISNLLRAMVSVNVVGYKIPLGPLLSFAGVYTILGLWFGLSLFRWHRQRKKEEKTAAVFILVSAAAFLYGYAAIYGKTLESFPRYMATPVLCLASYLLLRDIPLCKEEAPTGWADKIKPGLFRTAICLCILGAAAAAVLWQYVFPGFRGVEASDAYARDISQAVLQDDPAPEDARVYLVMAGDGVENCLYHHRIYLSLLSREVNLRNRLFETRVIASDQEDTAASWSGELREGFDYVYVLSVEEGLIPVFTRLSTAPPADQTLYRIVPANNEYGICLVPV